MQDPVGPDAELAVIDPRAWHERAQAGDCDWTPFSEDSADAEDLVLDWRAGFEATVRRPWRCARTGHWWILAIKPSSAGSATI